MIGLDTLHFLFTLNIFALILLLTINRNKDAEIEKLKGMLYSTQQRPIPPVPKKPEEKAYTKKDILKMFK